MNTQHEYYPIFMKAHRLNLIIVGGDRQALKVLTQFVNSSSKVKLKMIATSFLPEIVTLAKQAKVTLVNLEYSIRLIHRAQLVVAASQDPLLNKTICHHARSFTIPVHVVDVPQLCDFALIDETSITSQGELTTSYRRA